jgi:very-short-patch-repair endonuclease
VRLLPAIDPALEKFRVSGTLILRWCMVIDLSAGSPRPKLSSRNPFAKAEYAVWMRNNPTPAETAYKAMLEKYEVKFLFQPLLMGFIPDFQILDKRIIVEIDGSRHDKIDQSEYDAGRDEIFCRAGWRVLRVKNDDALNSSDTCINTLRNLMALPRLKVPKQRSRRDRIRALGRKSRVTH